MSSTIKVAIAEDHVIVRQGFVSLFREYVTGLNEKEKIEIIYDVSNGKELLAAIKSEEPNIVLLDIEMPEMGGLETLHALSGTYPEIKVIMITGFYHSSFIAECINLGASAYLPKTISIERLVQIMHQVKQNGHYYDDEVLRAIQSRVKVVKSNITVNEISLTIRERQVLDMLLENKANKEIANILGISTRTVEGHRSTLMKKTNSRNFAALLSFAFESKGKVN